MRLNLSGVGKFSEATFMLKQLTVLAASILCSCQLLSPTYQTPKPTAAETQAAVQRYHAAYQEALAAVERYRKSSESENADSKTIEGRLSSLEQEAQALTSLGGSLAGEARETRSRHTQLAFAYADAALEKGALEVADRTYRRLIDFYVGAAYSGIRDKARIGIDDVRSKRAASPSK